MKAKFIKTAVIVVLMVLIFLLITLPLFPQSTIAFVGENGKTYIFRINCIGMMEIKCKFGYDGLMQEHRQKSDKSILEHKRKFLFWKERKEIRVLLDKVRNIGPSQYYNAIDSNIPNIYALIDGEKYWCPYHPPGQNAFDDNMEWGDILELVEYLLQLL